MREGDGVNVHYNRPRRQRGVAAVEFALLVAIFLSFLVGVMELSRAMYVFQTLQEVTRRAASAAAHADFSDPAQLDRVRQHAVLRSTAGELPLGAPVTDRHVRIEYLALPRDAAGNLSMTPVGAADLAANPARNRETCNINPNSTSCIRLVRVQICNPGNGAACDRVPYELMLPLLSFDLLLPRATTIATAESLGYRPGQAAHP